MPRRYARKIFEGRGLYLLVMPNGSRYWRYNYRFGGKHKTLALGVHPDVCLEKARARHQLARSLLADGIDPSASGSLIESPPRLRVKANASCAYRLGREDGLKVICAPVSVIAGESPWTAGCFWRAPLPFR